MAARHQACTSLRSPRSISGQTFVGPDGGLKMHGEPSAVWALTGSLGGYGLRCWAWGAG